MPDAFLDPILERVRRSQRAGMRIGTLTAIDAPDASVTVDCAGDVIPGVRWVGSYSPTVGDKVVVSRIGSMWIILGKMSKQIGAPTVIYGTVRISAFQSDFTSWDTTQPELGWYAWSFQDVRSGWQGRKIQSSAENNYAIMYLYPAIAPALPVGATVTGARLSIRRHFNSVNAGAALAGPAIYQHDKTFTPLGPNGPPPPTLGSVWRPGTLGFNEIGIWELPSAWLTAWLAGTTKGITLYSDAAADLMYVGGANTADLTISYYSTPV